jgi:hypothetical protein
MPRENSGSMKPAACEVRHQRVADRLARGVLQPSGAHPAAHRAGALELGGDVGVLRQEAVELLLGRAVGFRVQPRVELDADAAQRVGGAGVVVEGDDPHPAAAEQVVQGSLVPPAREAGVGQAHVVEGPDPDEVVEQGPGVVPEPCRLLTQGELLRQHRPVTTGVHDELRPYGAPRRQLQRRPVVVEVHVDHGLLLQDTRAVLHGDGQHPRVDVLAEIMVLRVQDLRDLEVGAIGGLLPLTLVVVKETEVPLDSALGRDVGVHALEGRQMLDLGNAVPFGDETHHHRGEGNGGLPDGELRMGVRVDQDHFRVVPREAGGKDRTGHSGSDDCDVIDVTTYSFVGHIPFLRSQAVDMGPGVQPDSGR